MRIAQRLAVGFADIVLLTCAISLLGVNIFTEAYEKVAPLQEEVAPAAMAMVELDAATWELADLTMEYAVHGQEEDREELQSAVERVKKLGLAYLDHCIGQEQREAAQQLVGLTDESISAVAGIVALKGRGVSLDEILQRERETLDPALVALREVASEQLAVRIGQLAGGNQAAHEIYVAGVRFSLLAVGLVALFAAAMGLLLTRTIAGPLRAVRGAAEEVAQGNLDLRVGINTKDEIGQLARALDEITAELKRSTVLTKNLEKEIAERVRAEEQMQLYAADLEQRNEELRQFAYAASHDLQEPLRMVGSFVQLLARRYEGKLDSDADEFIAFAVDGVGRMQDMIQALLEYSRVGMEGKAFTPTDCSAVLDRALVNLQTAIEASGAAVTHDPLPTVMADEMQLGQLLQNLISNGVKFRGEDPPRVHVSAEQKGNQWVFSVRDNGIGIDPEHSDRIFSLFQRLHSREEYPGTGVGLALCKKIVELHGGRIWVESQPGRGSTFYFTLHAVGGK